MSIPRIEFTRLGRSNLQIGFGCGGLFERSSLRHSAKMLEPALLGVTGSCSAQSDSTVRRLQWC
jgi:hypothetical protein